MPQIPILSGIYTDSAGDFRASYPINLIPVAQEQGISAGYLRPADGIIENGAGPGPNRGAILWEGVLYRVMGENLISVASDGTVTVIGIIPGAGRVDMTYSFDRLAIAGGGRLFYYDGAVLSEVTDPDLGEVLSLVWVDGYFMTTDGEFLVITELANPFAVDPLKYGSSEADPDPVLCLRKLRNEVYALNRHTIEVFDNIGSTGFPFQRIEGAQIQKGTLGRHTACVFMEAIAFIGSGMNEAPAVYLAANGQAVKVSSREIDLILSEFTEEQLASSYLEKRIDRNHEWLVMHLPGKTMVYDAMVSKMLEQPIWFYLSSSVDYSGEWRASDLTWAYDRWNTADTQTDRIGYLTQNEALHWGEPVGWEFATTIIYNEGRGALIHELELVALTGRVQGGNSAQISTEYSADGMSWSVPRFIAAGQVGNRTKRLIWLQQGNMRHWRVQKFRGTSDAFLSFARLEARIEALNF
jgi:hypothetical protein